MTMTTARWRVLKIVRGQSGHWYGLLRDLFDQSLHIMMLSYPSTGLREDDDFNMADVIDGPYSDMMAAFSRLRDFDTWTGS